MTTEQSDSNPRFLIRYVVIPILVALIGVGVFKIVKGEEKRYASGLAEATIAVGPFTRAPSITVEATNSVTGAFKPDGEAAIDIYRDGALLNSDYERGTENVKATLEITDTPPAGAQIVYTARGRNKSAQANKVTLTLRVR